GKRRALRHGVDDPVPEPVPGERCRRGADRRQLAARRARGAGAEAVVSVRRVARRGAHDHLQLQRAASQGLGGKQRAQLAGAGQRSAGKGQGLRVADHPLRQRRGLASQGRGQGQGFGGRPLQQRLLQRQGRGVAGGQPPGRRQHYRDRRGDQGAIACLASGAARQHDPADRRGPGDSGGVPVSREFPCLADPDPGGAGVAGRHVRHHVPVRLFPEQPVADGVDSRHRAGGRRRHRGAGKHLPAHRRRRAAHGSGVSRGQGSRLHAAVDERVAGGRVHLHPVHGRAGREPVPRVL
nr:hypothetical protein [Tanacetum cinerariifolium]